MNILSPEQIIKQNICLDKPLPKIREEYHIACGIMEKYKVHILDECGKDFNKVIAKVNFLMRACLNGNKALVDQFLVDYGTMNDDGEFGLNFNKIISDGENDRHDG